MGDFGELGSWGFDADWQAAFDAQCEQALEPARVTVGYRRLYDLATRFGAAPAAKLSGKYKHAHDSEGPLAFPAVGDWVAVDLSNPGTPIIRDLLPRRTAFVRKAAGRPDDAQVVAANVDTVFLVSAVDGDLNPRRIERYLAMAHESEASPVIVLNKIDQCDDVEKVVASLDAVRGDTPVHTLAAKQRIGVDELKPYFANHATVALLGSSGVGKSTIANQLLQEDVQKTRSLGNDGKGRHTTTNRYLFQIAGGGLILDTPGMRELHIWEGQQGIDEAFADIIEVAEGCRFRDCKHQSEPGCAVRCAITDGELDAKRLSAYLKLLEEKANLEDETRTRRYR